MTESLRFPWGSDGDGARREVAPSVFRPRKTGTSVGRLRSHASRPAARPASERSEGCAGASRRGSRAHGPDTRQRPRCAGLA